MPHKFAIVSFRKSAGWTPCARLIFRANSLTTSTGRRFDDEGSFLRSAMISRIRRGVPTGQKYRLNSSTSSELSIWRKDLSKMTSGPIIIWQWSQGTVRSPSLTQYAEVSATTCLEPSDRGQPRLRIDRGCPKRPQGGNSLLSKSTCAGHDSNVRMLTDMTDFRLWMSSTVSSFVNQISSAQAKLYTRKSDAATILLSWTFSKTNRL